jgi:hypothetical protein
MFSEDKIQIHCTDFFVLIKAVAMVKKTPAYKNKLRALELERSGGITNKKKGQKNKDRYGIILILYSPCMCFLIMSIWLSSLRTFISSVKSVCL